MARYSTNFVAAAKAAGTTPENFARRLRGLLSPAKCRDTSSKIFSADFIAALPLAREVSQH